MWRFRKREPDRKSWEQVLRGCDLLRARDQIADLFVMINAEGKAKGGQYSFRVELVEAWKRFYTDPCRDAAVALLEVDPTFARIFEACQREGGRYRGYPSDPLPEPLETLSLAIVVAADKSSRIITGRRDGAVASTADIFVFSEFLCFFLHLTMREAFELRFQEVKMEKLRNYLGPLMSGTAVDSFFKHWPEDRKSKLRSDFFDMLNEVEVEYSMCEPLLMSKEGPLAGNTLLSKLAGRVAAAAGHPDDRKTMLAALSAAVDAIEEAHLNELEARTGVAL
jgi:hypothetical protein